MDYFAAIVVMRMTLTRRKIVFRNENRWADIFSSGKLWLGNEGCGLACGKGWMLIKFYWLLGRLELFNI